MPAAWGNNPLENYKLPLHVRHHEEWPRVDCSDVRDANDQSICTVYNNNSALIACLIVDALEAFNEKLVAMLTTPAAPSPHDEKSP